MKKKNNWKFKVDNRMHGHGDIDYDQKVIRVNKSKNKNKRPGEKLDTIVHELNHLRHQKMTERQIVKKTKRDIKKMSPKRKQKLYSKFR
jgi:uncharacterized membrane protein